MEAGNSWIQENRYEPYPWATVCLHCYYEIGTKEETQVKKDSFWESDKGQKLLTEVPPDAKGLEKQLLKGVPDAFKCMSFLRNVQ